MTRRAVVSIEIVGEVLRDHQQVMRGASLCSCNWHIEPKAGALRTPEQNDMAYLDHVLDVMRGGG